MFRHVRVKNQENLRYFCLENYESKMYYTRLGLFEHSYLNWWFGFMAHQPLEVIYVKSIFIHISWLVVWVLWYINLCRLFNAESIFMKILLLQTIQFSICMQFKCKYILIVKNISISSYSVKSNSSNSANSVEYEYRFYLQTVKCQNSSILNNSVLSKYSFNGKKQFHFQ